MSSEDGRGATVSIVEPVKGDVLGCRLGLGLDAVIARCPGGEVTRGGGGTVRYSLTQVVGRCAARLRVSYQFIDDALTTVSMNAATEVQDGLGRHQYQRVVEEIVQGLGCPPTLQDEGYLEYDVGVTRIVCDGLDAMIRFEELL